MREDELTEDELADDKLAGADADRVVAESERAFATLIAGGLLGAAVGAGLGLLASRAVGGAAAPAAPAPAPAAAAPARRRRGRALRGGFDDYAERIERELRALRRVVLRQRRRGWLR